MFALDLARAHIHNLRREAALSHCRAAAPTTPSRLRRLVTRTRVSH